MSKLFRPKCMRRMAVFLALIAPIVYLFGSYFNFLAGAHGSVEASYQLQSEYTAEVLQEYNAATVQDFHYTDVINGGVASFTSADTAFSVDKTHYYYYSVSVNVSTDYYPVRCRYPFLTSAAYPVDGHVSFNGFSNWGAETNFGSYFWIQFLGNSGESVDVYITYDRLQVIDLSLAFPSLSDPNDLQSAYNSYLSSSVYSKGINYQDYLVSYTGDAFDYLSHGFFAKDNFLVQIGRDALSEDPHGFAPFGYFWSYLDDNVLHLSTMQVGLMAYGYMYYASHVLLFDVGFILVTFFLTFIQKVADKIGGEDHA